MGRLSIPPAAAAILMALGPSGAAHAQGAAGIEQIPPTRASATVAPPMTDKAQPAVSAKVLAACQKAQADDRPAPAGVDCIKALQVATAKSPPAQDASAEGSLLSIFGLNSAITVQAPADGGGSTSADQVSRQLSSGDFQGTGTTDAAASVARDRPPPQSAPPPR